MLRSGNLSAANTKRWTGKEEQRSFSLQPVHSQQTKSSPGPSLPYMPITYTSSTATRSGKHCNFKNKQTKQNQSKLKTKHYCIRLSLDWAVSSTEFSLWLWEGKLSVLWYCLLQDPTITLEEGSSHMQCQHLPTTQGPPPAQPFAAAKPALLVFADGCLSREWHVNGVSFLAC